MSARNTLEAKKQRREERAAAPKAEPVARLGTCVVTGRQLPVDFEFSISEPAWLAIRHWQHVLLRDMERESMRNPDMVKLNLDEEESTEDAGTASD